MRKFITIFCLSLFCTTALAAAPKVYEAANIRDKVKFDGKDSILHVRHQCHWKCDGLQDIRFREYNQQGMEGEQDFFVKMDMVSGGERRIEGFCRMGLSPSL